jgi:hypothetical protein
MQAGVLQVIAAVLSQQRVVQSLLLQAPPTYASLVRLLLHIFAPAALPEQHTAADDGIQVAADAAGHAAAQSAGARAASPIKGAAGNTAAKPAAAAGAKTPGAAAGGTHEQAAPGAGATTPRKGAAASSSGAKEQKVNPYFYATVLRVSQAVLRRGWLHIAAVVIVLQLQSVPR